MTRTPSIARLGTHLRGRAFPRSTGIFPGFFPGFFPGIFPGICLAAVVLLAGCGLLSQPPQPRGARVDPDQLAKLMTGRTTEADATTLLGSPTAKGTFDPNVWLYVAEMTRPEIGGTNAVVEQRVTELRFNDQGVLQSVRQLGKADALAAPMVARTTPSPGTDTSILQQLFGNVGRYNPVGGSGFGGQRGPTVGAPVTR